MCVCVPGVAGDEVKVVVGVEEGHVIVPDTAVDHVHQTGSGNALHFHPESLRGAGRAVRKSRTSSEGADPLSKPRPQRFLSGKVPLVGTRLMTPSLCPEDAHSITTQTQKYR